mgnify:FL=1
MQNRSAFNFVALTDAKYPGDSQNQDAVYAAVGLTGGKLPYGLFVVADGVGGLKDGSRASLTVTETLADHFEPIWPAITAVSDRTVTRLRQQLKKAIIK